MDSNIALFKIGFILVSNIVLGIVPLILGLLIGKYHTQINTSVTVEFITKAIRLNRSFFSTVFL